VVEVKEKIQNGGTEIKKVPQVKYRLVFNVEQTEPVKVS
jgi:hypothetical protein